jgi:hypothetical protein
MLISKAGMDIINSVQDPDPYVFGPPDPSINRLKNEEKP